MAKKGVVACRRGGAEGIWAERIQAWRDSGQTQVRFCAQLLGDNGLSVWLLRKWRWRPHARMSGRTALASAGTANSARPRRRASAARLLRSTFRRPHPRRWSLRLHAGLLSRGRLSLQPRPRRRPEDCGVNTSSLRASQAACLAGPGKTATWAQSCPSGR